MEFKIYLRFISKSASSLYPCHKKKRQMPIYKIILFKYFIFIDVLFQNVLYHQTRFYKENSMLSSTMAYLTLKLLYIHHRSRTYQIKRKHEFHGFSNWCCFLDSGMNVYLGWMDCFWPYAVCMIKVVHYLQISIYDTFKYL